MGFGIWCWGFEFGVWDFVVWGFVLLVSDQDLKFEDLIGVRHSFLLKNSRRVIYVTLDRPHRNLVRVQS